jgi:hypothetical protein
MSFTVSNNLEPSEAFPYKPPTQEILQKYRHLFKLNDRLGGIAKLLSIRWFQYFFYCYPPLYFLS